MKLLYATSITLPSYRANRIQVSAMARAFARILGPDFILGIGSTEGEPLEGVALVSIGEARSYTLAWRYLAYAKRHAVTHLYCREEKLLFFMILFNQFFFGLPLAFCYELHHLVYLPVWWHSYLLRHVRVVVSITAHMRDALAQDGFPASKVIIAPDAVDVAAFSISQSKQDARRELGLPEDKKIVIYTGDISEPWKGGDTLYEASKEFGEECLFLVVGSKPHHIEHFRAHHPDRPNFVLAGYKPHERIPLYLRSADLAILPNSAKSEISRVSTSPMKLFEYMAAGLPIVASRLPSICEVLDERLAVLVTPDDAQDLARGIRELLGDPARAASLGEKAREDAAKRTWTARAQMVLSSIQ